MFAGRRIRTWVAVAGTALGLVAAGSVSAEAAPEVSLTIEAPHTGELYSADEGSRGRQDDFEFLVRPHDGVAGSVVVTVDARALHGVGTLSPGHRCEGTDNVFTCRFDPADLRYASHVKPFHLAGRAGVQPGDGGTVKITARADNADPVSAQTRLEVTAPSLVSNGPQRLDGYFAAGKAIPLRPSFANRGDWEVPSYAVKMSTYAGNIAFDRTYSNCWYSGSPSGGESRAVWCQFDTPLPPHSAWRPAKPLTGRLDPGHSADSVRYELTYRPRNKDTYPVQGEGSALKLESIPDSEVHDSPKGSSIQVFGTAQVDYAAVVEGSLHGHAGQTKKLRIGAENVNGGKTPGLNPDHVELRLPEGTRLLSTPYSVDGDAMDGACQKSHSHENTWECPLRSEAFSPFADRKGARTTLTANIRIDRVVPGAVGEVRTVGKYDRAHSNDTVALRTAPGGGTTWWSTTRILIGVGLALVVVSAAVALVFRRRRRPSHTA